MNASPTPSLGPRPMTAGSRRVVHTSSGNRIAWVGRQGFITLQDGTEERCPHHSGHRSAKALRACLIKMVDRANRAAGIDPRTYKTKKAS